VFTIFSYAAIMAGKLIIFTSLNDGQILDHPSKRVPVVFVSLETFTNIHLHYWGTIHCV